MQAIDEEGEEFLGVLLIITGKLLIDLGDSCLEFFGDDHSLLWVKWLCLYVN